MLVGDGVGVTAIGLQARSAVKIDVSAVINVVSARIHCCNDGETVCVGVFVAVLLEVGVFVAVLLDVRVCVAVLVEVAVLVDDAVLVLVGVFVLVRVCVLVRV